MQEGPTEADGDMGKAEEILRVKLGNKATKAASRSPPKAWSAIYRPATASWAP